MSDISGYRVLVNLVGGYDEASEFADMVRNVYPGDVYSTVVIDPDANIVTPDEFRGDLNEAAQFLYDAAHAAGARQAEAENTSMLAMQAAKTNVALALRFLEWSLLMPRDQPQGPRQLARAAQVVLSKTPSVHPEIGMVNRHLSDMPDHTLYVGTVEGAMGRLRRVQADLEPLDRVA